jgi:hypothetical protein
MGKKQKTFSRSLNKKHNESKANSEKKFRPMNDDVRLKYFYTHHFYLIFSFNFKEELMADLKKLIKNNEEDTENNQYDYEDEEMKISEADEFPNYSKSKSRSKSKSKLVAILKHVTHFY